MMLLFDFDIDIDLDRNPSLFSIPILYSYSLFLSIPILYSMARE